MGAKTDAMVGYRGPREGTLCGDDGCSWNNERSNCGPEGNCACNGNWDCKPDDGYGEDGLELYRGGTAAPTRLKSVFPPEILLAIGENDIAGAEPEANPADEGDENGD